MTQLQQTIEKAWDDRSLLTNPETIAAIREVIRLCDEGILRCAQPTSTGWQVNEWVKKAVVLYFQFRKWKPWKPVSSNTTIKFR